MSNNILKEYYEKDADRFWDPTLGMVGRDLDVYPLLADLKGQILEYGCGAGSLILNLALEERFSKCIGVDISEKAIQKLRDHWKTKQLYHNKLELLLPMNDKLPTVPPKSMDAVISVATIEHVYDPYIVLDEFRRITKNDGVLICSVPNYGYIKHIIYLLFGQQPRTGTDLPVSQWRNEGWDGMHLHTFTKKSFEVLLKDCGWMPEKWVGCGSRFNWTGVGLLRKKWPSLWSGELIVRCRKIQSSSRLCAV